MTITDAVATGITDIAEHRDQRARHAAPRPTIAAPRTSDGDTETRRRMSNVGPRTVDDGARTEAHATSFAQIEGALQEVDPGRALERLAAAELAASNTVTKTLETLDAAITDGGIEGGPTLIEHVLAAGLSSSDPAAVDATLYELKQRNGTVLLERGRLAGAIDTRAIHAATNGAWLRGHTELLPSHGVLERLLFLVATPSTDTATKLADTGTEEGCQQT